MFSAESTDLSSLHTLTESVHIHIHVQECVSHPMESRDTSEASPLAHLSFYCVRGLHWAWIIYNNTGLQGGWIVAERKFSNTDISVVESLLADLALN